MGGGKFPLHFCMNQTLFKMKNNKIKRVGSGPEIGRASVEMEIFPFFLTTHP